MKECRKDILIENQYINEKARIAVTPKKTRILSLLKDNKMRIYYFFGFCLLFSLDKVYDGTDLPSFSHRLWESVLSQTIPHILIQR